jgi:hypothetical protein
LKIQIKSVTRIHHLMIMVSSVRLGLGEGERRSARGFSESHRNPQIRDMAADSHRSPTDGRLQQVGSFVPGACWIRQCRLRVVAGDGPVPQHGPRPVRHRLQVRQGLVRVRQPLPAQCIATKESCTASSAVAASRSSSAASRTSDR